MIHFTCKHCENPINGLIVVVDNSHIVHNNCKEEFEQKNKEKEVIDEHNNNRLLEEIEE